MQRKDLIKVFQDTRKLCKEEPLTYWCDEHVKEYTPKPCDCSKKIKVVEGDSLSCSDFGDVILNFASCWTPGGGVQRGYNAQEENLCLRTSLYKSLTSNYAKYFYDYGKAVPNLGINQCIISLNVEILKDENFNMLPEIQYTNVISVAAPRLTDGKPCTDEELEQLLVSRIRYILLTCIENNFSRPILGAWGCGAYRNNPKQIARIFKEQIYLYGYYFNELIFAIPKGENHNIFKSILQ